MQLVRRKYILLKFLETTGYLAALDCYGLFDCDIGQFYNPTLQKNGVNLNLKEHLIIINISHMPFLRAI